MALICLNIQLPGVFWVSVNCLETNKYLLYYIFDFRCLFVALHLEKKLLQVICVKVL
jgi:hypothetical protein